MAAFLDLHGVDWVQLKEECHLTHWWLVFFGGTSFGWCKEKPWRLLCYPFWLAKGKPGVGTHHLGEVPAQKFYEGPSLMVRPCSLP